MCAKVASFDSDELVRRVAKSWHKAFGVPEKVKSLSEFVNAPPLLNGGGNRPIFRGEAKIFEVPLQPSLFRSSDSFQNELEKHEIEQIREAFRRYSEEEISDRFLNAFAPMMHRDDLNWMFFAQHIGLKTRLLDVTQDPLVALYFACDDNGEDGVVYFFQTAAYRPIKRKHVDWLDDRDYPKLPISFLQIVSGEFDRVISEDVPYLVFPDLPHERLLAQKGGFFFLAAS